MTSWTKEDDKAISDMLASGMSSRLIAETFGVTKNAIVGRIDRQGLRIKDKVQKSVIGLRLKDLLADHVANGGELRDAWAQLEISPVTVNILWREIRDGLGYQAV